MPGARVSIDALIALFTALAVPHRQDARERDVRHREGGHPHPHRQILCLQGHQQEAHAGARAYGAWRALHGDHSLAHATNAQVRNEIAVLKRISSGHKNIVTLHDYFEVRGSRKEMETRC